MEYLVVKMDKTFNTDLNGTTLITLDDITNPLKLETTMKKVPHARIFIHTCIKYCLVNFLSAFVTLSFIPRNIVLHRLSPKWCLEQCLI